LRAVMYAVRPAGSSRPHSSATKTFEEVLKCRGT
jgi:hypothetical protein